MRPFLLATLAAAGLATCACSGSTPAAQATHTVTVAPSSPAASQSATAATAPTPSPSGTAAAGCLSRYLHGGLGLSQGTAGSIQVVIVFKNLDNVACTLYGYPGVALAAGTPVTNIGQPSTENPSTPRKLVTLPPHGYANVTLQVTDALNYPAGTCKPAKSTWLAVIPPNQTVPLYVPYSSTACKSLKVKLLTVTTVSPGNGG
jgi:hypothetical protein